MVFWKKHLANILVGFEKFTDFECYLKPCKNILKKFYFSYGIKFNVSR